MEWLGQDVYAALWHLLSHLAVNRISLLCLTLPLSLLSLNWEELRKRCQHYFFEVSPLVSTACLTCASWALSPRSYIPFVDVTVLMVFRHVLWPCVHCLQRAQSGNMPGACFQVCFAADCFNYDRVFSHSLKKKNYCGKQLVLIRNLKKKKLDSMLKHLLLSLSLDQQWCFGHLLCES